MKKQASDQQFHNRRHQERQRAEAAKKAFLKKVAAGESAPTRPVGESAAAPTPAKKDRAKKDRA